jgi:hypothetical protein
MSKLDDYFKARAKQKHCVVPTVKPTRNVNALKGLKGGWCNVTACQKPGANYYNKSTQKYYCEDCAREINWPGGHADCMELYGTPYLCELEP